MNSTSYQSIQEKMGDSARLDVSELLVSEYNARCSFVDRPHVEHLANLIQERGFHPTRAISVNIIQNAVGETVSTRVVAGRHRFEAAKLAGRTHIPCVQYFGLTDEEEVLLDRWDNEMDEEHKPVHFFEDAEHYGFLKERKTWSQRKIARVKGVSKGTTGWKLKIAALPEEVKAIVKGAHNECPHCGHLVEAHFREICKLQKSGHMILIIKEIIERGQAEKEETLNNLEVSVRAMKQREVANRVSELLELESREEKSPEVYDNSDNMVKSTPASLPGGHHGDHPEEGESTENRFQPTSSVAMKTAPSSRPSSRGSDDDEFLAELREQRIAEQMSNGPLGVDSEKRSTAAMKFDIEPRWLKHSSLSKTNKPLWLLFVHLIQLEMRYKYGEESTNEEDGYFFIGGSESTPEWTYQYLGEILDLKPAIIQKKLRTLEKHELIRVERAELPRYPRFQIRWDHLKNLYDEEGWSISFEEGGLAKLPPDFSGQVGPTPLHTIWVRDGIVQDGIDRGVKETIEDLEKLGASSKFAHRILKENYFGTLRQVLAQLPSRMDDYQQKNGEEIRKPLDFFLGCLEAAKMNQKGI